MSLLLVNAHYGDQYCNNVIKNFSVQLQLSSNLINESHHGFHNKCSTVIPLLSAVDDWASSLERCNSVHCLFLDLTCKGIWLSSLLSAAAQTQKLTFYHGSTHPLLSIFKKLWLMVVSQNGFLFYPGFPKILFLAPCCFFCMLMCELHQVIHHNPIKLFADDFALTN